MISRILSWLYEWNMRRTIRKLREHKVHIAGRELDGAEMLVMIGEEFGNKPFTAEDVARVARARMEKETK